MPELIVSVINYVNWEELCLFLWVKVLIKRWE